jgi:hypothetical protein
MFLFAQFRLFSFFSLLFFFLFFIPQFSFFAFLVFFDIGSRGCSFFLYIKKLPIKLFEMKDLIIKKFTSWIRHFVRVLSTPNTKSCRHITGSTIYCYQLYKI